MEVKETNAFLVVSTKHGAFGKGMTLETAVRNLKRELGSTKKQEVKVLAFSCTTEEIKVQCSVELTYVYPLGTTVMRFSAKL